LMYRIKNQHLYDFVSLNELEEQAKAMEKEQIIDAYDKGAVEYWDSEEYYKYTYLNDTQGKI
jgi:hypothetical protein